MDATKVGLAAARLMEILDDYPEGTELREVGIVAEIFVPDPDTDPAKRIRTPTYCTNESRIYQAGLWDWALDVAQHGEVDDDDT